MTFEWDENKNNTNKQKHGVSFETAARVFLDPNVIVVPDPFIDEGRYRSCRFIAVCCLHRTRERHNSAYICPKSNSGGNQWL